MLTVPIPTQRFNPVAWARKQYWLPFDPRGTITDIPGAGVLPTRRIPIWPALPSQSTFVSYWQTQPKWGTSLAGLRGLGIPSIFDQAADLINREVNHEAEAAVKKAVLRYVVPPMVISIGLSLIALAVALNKHGRAANRRRRARRYRIHRIH